MHLGTLKIWGKAVQRNQKVVLYGFRCWQITREDLKIIEIPIYVPRRIQGVI